MYKDESRVPYWDGTERIDGVKIVYVQRQSRWEILTGEGRERITMCPCCEKIFPMARAAKLAAAALSATGQPAPRPPARHCGAAWRPARPPRWKNR